MTIESDDEYKALRASIAALTHEIAELWRHAQGNIGTPPPSLAPVRELLESVMKDIGQLLGKLQRKRNGPTEKTKEDLEKIRRWRAEGKSWAAIDNFFGFNQGQAREKDLRARKKGY